MKKHFVDTHKTDWDTFVKTKKFMIKLLQKRTQTQVVKKPTRKPKPKNTVLKKKPKVVKKIFKKPTIVREQRLPLFGYDIQNVNHHFNQYNMLDMYRCNICHEVVQPELVFLHARLGCRKRFLGDSDKFKNNM